MILNKQTRALFSRHPRSFHENKFAYPVLSRRSRGMSVGINLNPDKVCNFDCIYCQVDRRSPAETTFVEMERLLVELDSLLELVTSGAIYEDEQFRQVPSSLRRLNDIAFSGDGEPTTYRNFDEVASEVAGIKRRRGLEGVRLLLITNASMFHRPAVQRALEILDANQGEIWAKLETGTEEYYQKVERTPIPFSRVLENITEAARRRPIVIQSLFMRIEGQPPPDGEIAAYCERLREITEAGGQIKLVQVYTVARPPAETYVAALTAPELQAIAERVGREVGLPTEVFP